MPRPYSSRPVSHQGRVPADQVPPLQSRAHRSGAKLTQHSHTAPATPSQKTPGRPWAVLCPLLSWLTWSFPTALQAMCWGHNRPEPRWDVALLRSSALTHPWVLCGGGGFLREGRVQPPSLSPSHHLRHHSKNFTGYQPLGL